MVEKKFERYYWTAGTITVTAIVLILTIVFAITPSLKSINKVSQELKENKEELKTLQKKLEKLKELKVKEAELKEQSNVVYRAVPTKKEVGDIFIELHGLISEAGGSGSKASGSNSGSSGSSGSNASASTPAPAGVNTLTYQTDVTLSSYQNFKGLLESTEKALRFVHLSDFKISGKDGFKVTLTYKVYYRGEQANVSVQTEGQE